MMEDTIKQDITQMVNSLTAGNNDARVAANKSLNEDGNEKNPEDYLVEPNDMVTILKLVKNKKLSANKIKQKIREYLKDPNTLKSFLKSIIDSRGKKETKEMTGTSSAGGYSEPLFTKMETKEATGSSSSGSYETPKIWAKSTNKKDWRGKSKPQIPGGKFVQVKKKCKKFPYCNQGDINALNIFEDKMLINAVNKVSQKFGINKDIIKEIIEVEISNTTTENQYKLIKENISLKEKLRNLIKKIGFESVTKIVGSLDKTFEIFDIKEPMDFLNLFNDLDVVQSEDLDSWTLYRYKKGHNFIVYDRESDEIYINYYEIWSVLEDKFGLKYSEIQELTKIWLDEVYNLRGVTSLIIGVDDSCMRSTI
jgi:ribosomal protein S18